MPRYYLNMYNEEFIPDPVGSEHASLESLRQEVVEAIVDLARKGLLFDDADNRSLMMNITNEQGLTVLILSLTASLQLVVPPFEGKPKPRLHGPHVH